MNTYPQQPDSATLALALQAQLKSVGIDVKISQVPDINTVVEQPTGWQAAIIANGFISFGGDYITPLDNYLRTGGPSNVTGVADPALDALIDRVAVELDTTARDALLRQIQTLVADRGYLGYLGMRKGAVVAGPRWRDYARAHREPVGRADDRGRLIVRLVLRRLGQAAVTLAGTAVLIFGMLAVTPGDPARTVLAARGVSEPSPPAIAAVRAELNLDDPLPVRFVRWAGGALTGDLGVSWQTGRPVSADVATLLPATLLLAGVAMALAVVLALVLGVAAGAAPRRWPDALSRMITFGFIAVPSFVIGVTLLDVLVVRAGLGRVIADGTLATVFLPALVLALSSAAVWSRVLRTSLLEAHSAPYVRIVTARGGGPVRRLLVHQLPHAAGPFLAVVGLGTGALLGGCPDRRDDLHVARSRPLRGARDQRPRHAGRRRVHADRGAGLRRHEPASPTWRRRRSIPGCEAARDRAPDPSGAARCRRPRRDVAAVPAPAGRAGPG